MSDYTVKRATTADDDYIEYEFAEGEVKDAIIEIILETDFREVYRDPNTPYALKQQIRRGINRMLNDYDGLLNTLKEYYREDIDELLLEKI